jgi:hypothetical protein
MAQNAIAYWLPSNGATRVAAMADDRYKTVHVTGNTQSGGVHGGFDKARYHAPGMNIEPVVAAAPQAARKIVNKAQSIFRT